MSEYIKFRENTVPSIRYNKKFHKFGKLVGGDYGNTEGADQPAKPCSLITGFVLLKPIMPRETVFHRICRQKRPR